MIILAVDPGYERLGIAILEKESKKESLVFSECFKTDSKLPHFERLRLIGEEISKVIKKYEPDALAIETLFFNENQKTAIAVAEARGAIICQSALSGLETFEFTPLQIKVAVTGYGRADKNQIISMVKIILKDKKLKKIKHDDEFDAIAIGLTFFAYHQNRVARNA